MKGVNLMNSELKDDIEEESNQFAQERTSGMNSLLNWVNELPKLT